MIKSLKHQQILTFPAILFKSSHSAILIINLSWSRWLWDAMTIDERGLRHADIIFCLQRSKQNLLWLILCILSLSSKENKSRRDDEVISKMLVRKIGPRPRSLTYRKHAKPNNAQRNQTLSRYFFDYFYVAWFFSLNLRRTLNFEEYLSLDDT